MGVLEILTPQTGKSLCEKEKVATGAAKRDHGNDSVSIR
jgi:hypothetical protein